jgi:hypothetical protein
MRTNLGMRPDEPHAGVMCRALLLFYCRGELLDELLDEFSTWFLQYFFMSLFDIPELLAFCCAMQSFICSFLAAWSLLLVLLLVLDCDVELGY